MVSNLTGCGSLGWFRTEEKSLEVFTRPLEKTPLDIPMPDPLKLKPLEWVVITPGNSEEIFKKLASQGNELAVFALTPDGYQSLAVTIAELRNFINTQRIIILKYKEYYEIKKDN